MNSRHRQSKFAKFCPAKYNGYAVKKKPRDNVYDTFPIENALLALKGCLSIQYKIIGETGESFGE